VGQRRSLLGSVCQNLHSRIRLVVVGVVPADGVDGFLMVLVGGRTDSDSGVEAVGALGVEPAGEVAAAGCIGAALVLRYKLAAEGRRIGVEVMHSCCYCAVVTGCNPADYHRTMVGCRRNVLGIGSGCMTVFEHYVAVLGNESIV
jgi:hypothetical protein